MDSTPEPKHITRFSDYPAAHAPVILAILTEVNPIADPEERHYDKRVERFSREIVFRRVMADVTPAYLDALVDRLFTPDEVADGAVSADALQRIRTQVVERLLGETKP